MLKNAIKEITRRKTRAVVSIAGYAIAVTLLILFISLFKQTEESSRAVLTNTGTHFIAFKPQCCAIPFLNEEYQEIFEINGIQTQLMTKDLIQKVKTSPAVKDASPFLMFKYKDEYSKVLIGGLEPENRVSVAKSSCAPSDIISGRFLTETDSNLVILEQAFAVAQSLTVGKEISLAGEKYKIIGIVNPGIRPAKADVYMPFKNAENLLRRWLKVSLFKDLMNLVLVESANAHVHTEAMNVTTELVGKESLISSYGCYKPASKAMNIHANSLKLFIIMTLLFVMSIALNSQLSALVERKRDIGIYQAVGWSDFRIKWMIFTETFLQALIGIAVGCGLSALVLTLPIFPEMQLQQPDWTVYFMSSLPTLLGAAIAGLISGFVFLRKEPFYNLYRTS